MGLFSFLRGKPETSEEVRKAIDRRFGEIVEILRKNTEAQVEVLKRIETIAARFTLPGEVMEELVGELRALRHLLDEKGAFSFMDKGKKSKRGGRS